MKGNSLESTKRWLKKYSKLGLPIVRLSAIRYEIPCDPSSGEYTLRFARARDSFGGPVKSGSVRAATSDYKKILGQFDVRYDNIGIRTGPEARLWVLHAEGDEARATLERWAKEFGPLPKTPIMRLGKDQEWYFFSWPAGRRLLNQRGVNGLPFNVQGHGGYVPAPPSVDGSGRTLEWSVSFHQAVPAVAPGWLLEQLSLVRGKASQAKRSTPDVPAPASHDDPEKEGQHLSPAGREDRDASDAGPPAAAKTPDHKTVVPAPVSETTEPDKIAQGGAEAGGKAIDLTPGAIRQIVAVPLDQIEEHALLSRVPKMRPAEWDLFLEDVREHCVQDPVILRPAGGKYELLDGRHRLNAAREANLPTIPARIEDVGADEAAAIVFRASLLRRNLTDDQRAALAALWAKERVKHVLAARARRAGQAGGRGRAKPPVSSEDAASRKLSEGTKDKEGARSSEARAPTTRQVAADCFCVGERLIREAKQVLDGDEVLFQSVLDGDRKIITARKELRDRKKAAAPTSSTEQPAGKKRPATVAATDNTNPATTADHDPPPVPGAGQGQPAGGVAVEPVEAEAPPATEDCTCGSATLPREPARLVEWIVTQLDNAAGREVHRLLGERLGV